MKTQQQIYQELDDLCKEESYWSKNKKQTYYRESSDNLLKLIKSVPHKSILEVGCAQGDFTKELLKISSDVTGIDVSEREIKRARKNAPGAKFHAVPLEDYNTNKKFDVIVCSEVIYYIMDRQKAYEKIKKLGKHLVTSHFIICLPAISLRSVIFEYELRQFKKIDRIVEKSINNKLFVVKTLRELSHTSNMPYNYN